MANRYRSARLLAVLLLLATVLTSTLAAAEDSYVYGLTIDKVSSRSGPGTEYNDSGTFSVKGEYLKVYSYTYDVNGVMWLLVETPYKGKMRRVYTGAKRFDMDTLELDSLDEEYFFDSTRVRVTKTVKAMYGPGKGYDTYSGLTVDKGMTVDCLQWENDYVLVQFEAYSKSADKYQQYRCWIPESTVRALD